MGEGSLKEKTVHSVEWSAVGSLLSYGITFLVGIILARLLTPEEYGLIGIVTIFTTIIAGFVDSGFSSALIRKIDVSHDDYNTMFFTNMVFSISLYVILFWGASFIAYFFERPQLIELIRVMGLIIITDSLSIVQNTNLSKKLDFKTKAKSSVFSALVSGIIGVLMAFAGFGVWSLVVQLLSRSILNSLALWFLNRWWPNLKFSQESFKYMWGFGWKLMLSRFLNSVWEQLNQMVVGKFYNPYVLGQFSKATEYTNLFSNNLSGIVQRVSYPILSEVQEDPQRMVSAYRSIIKVTMFVTCVILISMAAVAEPFIYCLIGPQWHQAAQFLPLICLLYSMIPLHSINLNMLQITGRSDIFLYLEIIKKFIAVGPILLGIFISIYWMLIGSIIIGIVSFFLNTYYTGKKLGYTSWMQIKDIAPSYVVAFVIAVFVYFFKYLPFSYFIILPIQIVVGMVVFFVICEKTKMEEYMELKAVAMRYLSKIKGEKI